MKNKLLTSILAIMLVLAASVSALEISVAPAGISMTEDTTATDAVTVTLTNATETDVPVCTGNQLAFAVGTPTKISETTWTYQPDLTPTANWNSNTNFKCSVGATNSNQVDVAIVAAPDAPAITDITEKQAVEDKAFSLQVAASDADNDTLTYTLTEKPTGMTISTTGLISWTPDNDQLGSKTVTVAVSDGLLNATDSFTVDVRPKKVCQYGIVGDLDMTVNEPDTSDEFKAGEDMQIEVDVENDGDENLDVIVNAFLYDLDEGKLLRSVKSEDTRIQDTEEENFDLKMTIPTTDFEANGNFMLYVAAYEDDEENCVFKQVSVELNREADDVIVTALELSSETAAPGSKVTATVTVENIGEDDQDGVYVKLLNSYLDLSMETKSFDLEDYKNDDNDKTETLTFEIPKGTPTGEYWIDAVVYFDNGRERASLVSKLLVETSSAIAEDEELPTLALAVETDLSAKAGKKLAIPVVVTNKGTSKAEFTLEVSNAESWAKVLLIEQPGQLNAGESGHAYVYLETKQDAASGAHDLSINLRNSLGLLATKQASVKLEGAAAEPAPAEQTAANRVTGLFTAGNATANLFWTVGVVVLAIVGLFFLRMLFKK